jgi:putative spermidine/putrescine transport system permease protein
MRSFFSWQRHNLITGLMLMPGFAAFFGLFFYPMLIVVLLSLRPEGQSTGWTLMHYVTFLSDPDAQGILLLTFFLAIVSTFLSVFISIPLALVLREKLAGHGLVRLAILVPITVPGLVGALGLLLFWGSRGWANLFLIDFVPFVQEPLRINYTIPGLLLFYVWHYFPYTCVTTLATLEGLDRSIEEAAAVSGANHWQVFRHILLPLLIPGILAGSVITFMLAFGAFSIPLVAGGNYRPLAVEIYKEIDVPIPPHWSAASAMAVVMAVIQVAFLTVYMRVLRRPVA